MLSPYRVLDLTDERGLLCGQILADLGADVIAVEPPGGSSARRIGPFAGDVPDPERSLYWWAYARNKRGITLDLDADDGREKLRQLVAGADFLIESAVPGEMAARGLGYDDLAAINRALVYVSITPFGQDGPKARYAATDLTVLAAGGVLAVQGDEDRPPVRVSAPQAFLHAGAEAAGAALVALHERETSGLGQHVDVSAQQAVLLASFGTAILSAVGAGLVTRSAGGLKAGPFTVRYVFPARDGHVSITFLPGSAIGPMTRRFMEYVYDEGGCDEATRDKDWINLVELVLSGREPIEELARVRGVVESFTASKTKEELLEAAMKHRLLVAPITTMEDLTRMPQLASREYWRVHGDDRNGKAVRYPGPFARLSATPIAYRREAPRVGEHTHEIVNGASSSERTGRRSGHGSSPADTALAGVKILDLMWVMAGPAATRKLADYGATVVRVESTRRLDVARTLGGWIGGVAGAENSSVFQTWNAGKLGMTLDLSRDAGRNVIRDLVRWADVVTESFSPRAMRAWGMDYEALRQVKPDLIMLSSCLMGQTGPMAQYAGFGNLAAALAGFYEVTGWPDRPPAGPYNAYTDTVSPRFSVAAIRAALDHRRRTQARDSTSINRRWRHRCTSSRRRCSTAR